MKKEKKVDVKKLVLFNYRDYPDINYISDFVDASLEKVLDSYDHTSNISIDIYSSILISNMLDYKLLNEYDNSYMIDKTEKLYRTISNKRARKGLENDEKCLEAVKKYYINSYKGEEPYSLFLNKMVEKYYTEKDLDFEEHEILIIDGIRRLYEYERTLRKL